MSYDFLDSMWLMEILYTPYDVLLFSKMVASRHSNSQHQELSSQLMWDVKVEPPLGVSQLDVELHLLC